MLKCLFRSLVVLAILLPALSYAEVDSLQDAVDAMDRGSYKQAYEGLLPLAREGDAQAQTLLGVIYNDGLGVKRDIQKARSWLYLAAEKEKADAAFLLGLSYLSKTSTVKENENAVYWIKFAARRDNLSAQRFMALAYEKGWMNVETNDKNSRYWWERYGKLSQLKSAQKNIL